MRSTLPDGSSLFEKTRSKKRRPFTDEEDRALKAGYEKHGTVWATIVKDPVFQQQGRRSTDLRDRFRNAFPELYQAAGYKPRNASKKRLLADAALPVRAATDDQLSMSTTGPVRSRRRAHTSQGLLRGGTKSVPQITACSEDEDSSAGEEDISVFKTPQTPVLVDNVSTSSSRSKKYMPFDDDEMDMITLDQSDPLSIPDFMPSSHNSYNHDMDGQSQTWSSGINTPTHSHAWSTAAGSPTSSHLSADYLMNSNSPSFHRRSDPLGNMGMIGKSAWGTQDWFSPNPRLDPGSSGNTSSSSYLSGDDGFSPSSPFSFQNLNHGVLDRYDLHPTLFPHDFSSEVGAGDSHSTFSDEMFPPSGFRGFTHHSNYAGDLIFGARTHQPQHPQNYSSSYGSGFGFGTAGLGLSGMSQASGIHPMLALPGIDEIELTGITLDDDINITNNDNGMVDDSGIGLETNAQRKDEPREQSLMSSDRFSLDDLVDLSSHELELHATPPGTPLLSRPRSARRSSESTFPHFHGSHGRSISVPPSEARMSMGLSPSSASSSAPRPAQHHSNSQPEIPAARPGRFFNQQQPSDDMAPDGTADKGVPHPEQQHTPAPPTPSPYPAQMLSPSTSHDPYAWRSMTPGDINLNLSFLDLHYYGHMPPGATGAAQGYGMVGDEDPDASSAAQNLRQGQALDLAQSIALSSSAALANASSLKSLGIPASLRQHIPQQAQGARGAGGTGRLVFGTAPATGAKSSTAGGARSHSNHHRGQSAVCPQDLVLRSDNKRKRASWDGAHA